MGIFDLIIWTIGGFLAFGLCAVIREFLEPILGAGFSLIIVTVLFFVLLILLTQIVSYEGSLEPGRPAFFGDPG